MRTSDAPRPTLRRGLVALAFCAAFGAGAVFADELQEASALLKAGQREQALEHVNKALAAKPRDPQARFLKGVILTEQGGTKEAIEIFTKLTQDFPELPEPYNNLAVIYASQGQYEKARTALEQSIRTHPSYATAYENLGDVYAKLASQAYDKALQLDKSNAGAQNKLSLVREIARGPGAVAAAPKGPAQDTPSVQGKITVQAKRPAPEKPPAADATADILNMVNGWAQAWSKKDVNAYLGYYAKDFKTPGSEPRAQWEKTRRARIEGAKSISVGVSAARVSMNGASQATVSFRQAYRSDRLKVNSSKTLVLEKAPDGRWQIQQEKSG